jgi:hypothetical protein
MPNNPLQAYYRQPKIYLTLPSGGKYYPDGALNGDPSNLPVFGMTAMDEILLKTPDALFSGESVVSVIKSCIPNIVDPWSMPTIDMDAALIAIRIATYGSKLPMTFKCKKCKEDNSIDLDLSSTLEYFINLEYQDYIYIDPLTVHIKPLTYKEVTESQLKQYELRKMLAQSYDNMSEEDRSKHLNSIFAKLSELQSSMFKRAISSVEADDTVVENKEQIQEWIHNSDAVFFETIKKHLEHLAETWKVQPQPTTCAACEAENELNINMDYSSFFVKR